VEQSIYPERAHLRTMIRDFLQQTISIPDRETLWERIESRLQDVLAVKDLYPVLRLDDELGFYLQKSGGDDPTPFKVEQEIITKLRFGNRPIFIDEAVASGRIVMTVEGYNWFKNRQVAVVFPMNLQSHLAGFVGLGHKAGGEDYSADELQVLGTFMSQVAMVSENLRLLEENLVKKRMEEELNLARRIQEKFLPQEIPETPGLEVAAVSRFCFEVAGDYHDVIALPGGETVLAVADVSGKGAGAALLMANLQASLRTSAGVGVGLPDLVARINDLIYQNTPPEQYISFFVAQFEPQKSEFTYVNAGHNPPILVRSDGHTELLDQGGLILGAIPGADFTQATIHLQPGDLIAMYTDGISEAMSTSGEEFGDDRILHYVKENHHLPAREVLTGLEAAASSFAQDAPYSDDMTLLLARVK
jgi:sigma-B regulation protein RsbU (phosphoserine phosphatase)